MKKNFWSAIALLAALNAIPAFASASSCVDCHSNAATMKALVPAPVASSGEGEG